MSEKWLWRDFGGLTLVKSDGGMPVVLSTLNMGQRGSVLATRDTVTGCLIPLTAEHPLAKSIQAIPQMVEFLEEFSRNYGTGKDQQERLEDWAKHARSILDELDRTPKGDEQ